MRSAGPARETIKKGSKIRVKLRDDYLPMHTFGRSVARFDGDRSVRIRTRLVREKKHKAGTTSIWRFYERHAITFKKNAFTPPSRIGLTLPRHALN